MKKYLIALIACFVPLAALAGNGDVFGGLATAFVPDNVKNDVFTAARTGDIKILFNLHQKSETQLTLAVNAKNKEGKTPLMIACQNGHELVAEYLVDQGADVNTKGPQGKPALYYAFKAQNQQARRELVKWLVLDKNAKPVPIDKNKAWFVDEALREGLTGVAEKLLPASMKKMNQAEKNNLLFDVIWRARGVTNANKLGAFTAIITQVINKGADINNKSIQEFWDNVEEAGNVSLFRYLAARPQLSVGVAATEFEELLKHDNPQYASIFVDAFLKGHKTKTNDCSDFLKYAGYDAEKYKYTDLAQTIREKKQAIDK